MSRPPVRSTKDLRTLCARGGVDQDAAHGSVMPPLYLSTNYSFAGFEQKRRYDYSRSGNPTRDVLAETLAALEGGAGCVVTGTGMAAVDLPLNLLNAGDLLVAPHDCYGGTIRLLNARAKKGHFELLLVDQGDIAALDAAIARKPRMVLVETPSNPLLRVVDIADICIRAHRVGAKVVADNTFLSPALQRPLELGADFVVHSTTKYINGHSDVVGGAVVSLDAADHTELAWWANCLGVTGGAFDSYLTLRGVRTLFARIERQQETAGHIAALLEAHAAVSAVHYPGLKSHPNHALASRQQQGPGAMLSFELAGGIPAVRTLIDQLDVFTLAESLGGVESLIAHPSTMTHAAMTPEAKVVAGITDGLMRISVGLEHQDDLIADLVRALDAVSVDQAEAA